jgi:uncharacterized protein
MENLSDKLKSLGVQIGAANLPPPVTKPKKFNIENVIQGNFVSSPLGDTFIVEDDYPFEYSHGLVNLHEKPSLDILLEWENIDRVKGDWDKYIFLDTETSGLAGGTGTFVFLLGVGYFENQNFHIKQYFMTSPAYETAFIREIDRLFPEHDLIVSFNGKTFDIPMLKTRYILNGVTPPFNQLGHIDMLHIARRLWRNRLPSRALGDLEKEIMQFKRSQEEVPGWLVPQIYFDYLHDGDARPLAGVFYHNAIDVVSLAALFIHTAKILANPFGDLVKEGLDIVAIAHFYEELGHLDIALQLYEYGLNQGLPLMFLIKTIHRYADIYKKQGQLDKAVEIWLKSADYHDAISCIELAKYFEHREKDYEKAIHWAKNSINWISEPTNVDTNHQRFKEDVYKRIARLESRGKLG